MESGNHSNAIHRLTNAGWRWREWSGFRFEAGWLLIAVPKLPGRLGSLMSPWMLGRGVAWWLLGAAISMAVETHGGES